MRVVLDTNALLLPVTDGTDVEDEVQRLVGAARLVVPSSVVAELERLAAGGGARSRAARAALRLVARADVEATTLPGDDGVLDVARRLGAVVVTNDRTLAASCAASGLRTIGSRERGRLAYRA